MSVLVLLAVAHAADNRTTLFGWGDNWYGVTWPVSPQYRTWAQPLPNVRGTVVAVDQSPYWAYSHAVAVRDDGTVIAWGDNTYGEGGFNIGGWVTRTLEIPREIAGPRDVTAVAAGGLHDLALTATGEVWAWGSNDSGQLGTGSIGGIGAPKPVVGLPLPAVAIAASGEASAAILSDGTVWTWGGDSNQELGDGSWASASPSGTPKRTMALPDRAVAIEGGESHFVALLADGTAASWGGNWHGELGRAGIPTSVNAWSAVPDRLSDWFGGYVKDVVDIDVGPQNTLLSTVHGEVLGCGANDAGQLPSVAGTLPVSIAVTLFPLTGALDVEMGGAGGMALNAAGELVAWGSCGYGMCGTGTGLTDPAHVVTTPEVVQHVAGATVLSGGPVSFLVIATSPGTDVWGTGGNGFGQIGNGSTTDLGAPVSIGFGRAVGIAAGLDHTLAVLDDGTVWAWGYNRIGQLGDGTNIDADKPVQVVKLDQVKQVAVGNELSVALRHDGTVWVWGSNWDGAFGDGNRWGESAVPVQVPGLDDVVAIAAGQYHVLALQSDGTVMAWGHVETAELGYWGTSTWVSTPTPVVFKDNDSVAISAGWGHSVVLNAEGRVFTFGVNDAGQLGTGSVDAIAMPPHPPEQVKLVDASGTELAATDIAAGGWLTMATVWDYSVYRWGDDIRNKRWLDCVPDGGVGDPLPVPLNVPAPALDLAGGYCSGFALTTEHTVWGYGSGKGGALGDGLWRDSITPVRMTLDGVNVIGPAGGHTEVLASAGKPPPPPPVCKPKDPKCW